ncbi:MAG: hypothetical protein R2834_11380 [Rhodothermales bacterium]
MILSETTLSILIVLALVASAVAPAALIGLLIRDARRGELW